MKANQVERCAELMQKYSAVQQFIKECTRLKSGEGYLSVSAAGADPAAELSLDAEHWTYFAGMVKAYLPDLLAHLAKELRSLGVEI